jgi:AcrR family transcriptional regulator
MRGFYIAGEVMASSELMGQRCNSAVARILEAGAQEFGKKGMADATMGAIALRAGISKQLVYHYYRNKEDLYCEVMQNLGKELHAPYFKTDFDSMSPAAAIEAFFNIVMDTNLYSEEHFFTDQMLHSGDQMLRTKSMRPLATRLIALLEHLLARAEMDGSIRGGVKAHFLLVQASLLASGFTSAKALMSRYLNHDFEAPDVMAEWRAHAVDSLMRTLAPASLNLPGVLQKEAQHDSSARR